MSDADARSLVDGAAAAGAEASDAAVDEGADVTLAQTAEGWLACAADAAFPIATTTSRLEVGPDDLLVVHAAAYQSEDDAVAAFDATTPLCVADVWETAVSNATAEVGLPTEIDADSTGDVGSARVTSELAGFPIGFEGRAGRDGHLVVVVLGGGSDVDGPAAAMVDDVLAAALA